MAGRKPTKHCVSIGTLEGLWWMENAMSQANAPRSIGWRKPLPDGLTVWIGPIDSCDADGELDFLNHLSPQLRRLRFPGLIDDPSLEMARGRIPLNPAKEAGAIAVVSRADRDQQAGAAHFYVNATGDRCDCSVTLGHAWQKRGVDSALMRRLVHVARARGIGHMRARAPAYSNGSQHLATRIGFRHRAGSREQAAVIYQRELP